MVKQISALIDTKDVNEWENSFIESVVFKTACGSKTTNLTEKQVETVENIWRKHFA
jgi:hypothetical protein